MKLFSTTSKFFRLFADYAQLRQITLLDLIQAHALLHGFGELYWSGYVAAVVVASETALIQTAHLIHVAQVVDELFARGARRRRLTVVSTR